MIGRSNLSKGGGSADVVNGIIEQYLAENETIDANTFVEFVNHYTDNTIVDIANSYISVSAVLLDTNRVFITHKNNNILNGLICTMSGNTITVGNTTTIWNESGSAGYYTSVTLIDTNKVFIAHNLGSSYNNMLAGTVCTISGSTITVGATSGLTSGTDNTAYQINTVAVSTNKVFTTYASNNTNSASLYGVLCTISDSTITVNVKQSISSSSGSADSASMIKIDTNKVFITHRSDNTNSKLNGVVCTMSGTTISKGTDTNLAGNVGGIKSSLVLLDTNKVFTTYISNNYLTSFICTISGTTISKGTDTTLTSVKEPSSLPYISATLTDANKVFIAHSDTTYKYLRGIMCKISSANTLTTGSDNILVGTSNAYEYSSAVLVDTNKVFITHRSDNTNNYLNGMIVYIDDMDILTVPEGRTIKPSVNKIHGLTKTSGTNSSPADVWVLDNE